MRVFIKDQVSEFMRLRMNKYEALLISYGAVVLPAMGHNLNSYIFSYLYFFI